MSVKKYNLDSSINPAAFFICTAIASDLKSVGLLFYETVTYINSRDYSPRQIEIWSRNGLNEPYWHSCLKEEHMLVARYDQRLAGFASIRKDGFLNHFYIHKDYQQKGIGSALLDEVEDHVKNTLSLSEITAEVSITARPFFEARDFKVISPQIKAVQGVNFENYIMKKLLAS